MPSPRSVTAIRQAGPAARSTRDSSATTIEPGGVGVAGVAEQMGDGALQLARIDEDGAADA
jgi:hypothetical protein